MLKIMLMGFGFGLLIAIILYLIEGTRRYKKFASLSDFALSVTYLLFLLVQTLMFISFFFINIRELPFLHYVVLMVVYVVVFVFAVLDSIYNRKFLAAMLSIVLLIITYLFF